MEIVMTMEEEEVVVVAGIAAEDRAADLVVGTDQEGEEVHLAQDPVHVVAPARLAVTAALLLPRDRQ